MLLPDEAQPKKVIASSATKMFLFVIVDSTERISLTNIVMNNVTTSMGFVMRLATCLVPNSPLFQSITGRRIRALREDLAWSQERLGVAIGIDESSARARISRYELGVHEPSLPTDRQVADTFEVPLSYLYCEDNRLAILFCC